MHHAVRVPVGIGIHQDGVHHAEHRRRRADPESQRKDRRQREPRHLDQLPKTESDVLPNGLHTRRSFTIEIVTAKQAMLSEATMSVERPAGWSLTRTESLSSG